VHDGQKLKVKVKEMEEKIGNYFERFTALKTEKIAASGQ